MKNTLKFLFILVFLIAVFFTAAAQEVGDEERSIQRIEQTTDGLTVPFVDLQIRDPKSNKEVALSIQLLLLLSVITIAPSIILLMTSFLRIAIVLNFIKRALSLQQVPPGQVLMGIALFLTIFVMWPTFNVIYNDSFKPFSEGKLSAGEMYKKAESPLKIFMFSQLRKNTGNIKLFMNMQKLPAPKNLAEIPIHVLIPAFILNELTIAFKIGILLFIPFIVIDMIVASILMSMGMIMLPPVMISLPFKLILFIMIDGWGLITQQLIASFR